MESNQKFDYAIIGGGVYGLSIAYHLAKQQKQCSIALFEKFTIGHDSGSSHGSTRISRGCYTNQLYSNLHRTAVQQYWPEMQKQLECKLLFKNHFVLYSQTPEIYEQYKKIIKNDNRFLIMSAEEVFKKYPHLPQIKTSNPVIVDTHAAIIAAEKYFQMLEDYLRKQQNIVIFQNTNVTDIRPSSMTVLIESQSSFNSANKIVLACGRWISQLAPQISNLNFVTKQIVSYLQMNNKNDYKIGRFPSFAYLGEKDLIYALPDLKYGGIKIGEHRNYKKIYESDDVLEKRLENRSKQMFGNKFKRVITTQKCYYTNTKNEEFLVDWIDPEYQRVLACSCCSGHGFKFAPLMGKIVSDLLIKDESIEQFQNNRHTFQIPYHQGVNLQ